MLAVLIDQKYTKVTLQLQLIMPTDKAWQLISEIRIGSPDFWGGETIEYYVFKCFHSCCTTAVTTEPRSRTVAPLTSQDIDNNHKST